MEPDVITINIIPLGIGDPARTERRLDVSTYVPGWQHGLEMATSSRGDNGKAPMVEQEDIGTEEGELLDVHPPLPQPVGRSGSDKKRKKHVRAEEGLLAIALLSPTAEDKRVENAREKAENDENYRQNSIFKHQWFVWFTQETNNQTPLEQRFYTPGSIRGIQNFRSHLMELAIEKFLEKKTKPDARPWETLGGVTLQ
ncbi:hypothetical protein R1sor_011577 [Riccia sorocarpa]|uniref:Uncharacterized protein n=1 Tax=Riccia sorocarpa TaxID=122646 RepID=A0ABD3I2L4_9MARC